jgi:hypothetical protein
VLLGFVPGLRGLLEVLPELVRCGRGGRGVLVLVKSLEQSAAATGGVSFVAVVVVVVVVVLVASKP